MRRSADVVRYLYRFLLEESRRTKFSRFESHRRSTRTSRTTRQTISSESDYKYVPRFKLIDPEFFFHEIRDGRWKPNLKNAKDRHRHQILPNTFAQWLMDCWLLEEGEEDTGDPFWARSDEYFVMPEVMAKYMRIEIAKMREQKSFITPTDLLESPDVGPDSSTTRRPSIFDDDRKLPRSTDEVFLRFKEMVEAVQSKPDPFIRASRRSTRRSDSTSTEYRNVDSEISSSRPPSQIRIESYQNWLNPYDYDESYDFHL